MKRIKPKELILLIIIAISLFCCFISTKDIIIWKYNSYKTTKLIKKIEETAKIDEVIDTEEQEIEIIESNEKLSKFDPYWDYLKLNLIDVDLTELKKINVNTKGWLQVNGTTINYPFVQSNDNKYYLTHSFDNSYNKAGWVFLDYRNSIDTLDKNTIIYAHSMLDRTMFTSLKNVLTSNWHSDSNNFIVKLSTEYENTLWQVFSVYRIPTTNDYIQVNFYSDEEFIHWSQKLLNRSTYNFNTSVNSSDKVLTLSTCYNDDEKVVLHAKLIKRIIKK